MQPVSLKRGSKLQKVSPFVGYKFKKQASSHSKKGSIYLPERDPPSFHLVLENMRNSFHYLNNKKNFEKPFINHLKKTGFDETGIICRKEWYTDKSKQKRRFGQGDDSFIDYPWVADKYWNLRQEKKKSNLEEKKKIFNCVVNSERKRSANEKNSSVLMKQRLLSAPFRRKNAKINNQTFDGYNQKMEEFDDRNLTERPRFAKFRPITSYKKNRRKVASKSIDVPPDLDKRRLQSADPRMRSEKRYRHYTRKQRLKRPRMKSKHYRKNDRFSRTPYDHKTGDWMNVMSFNPVRAQITKKITKKRAASIDITAKSRSRSKQKYCTKPKFFFLTFFRR